MRSRSTQRSRRLVEYDAIDRRLWILGQRCHHGATGGVVAVLACVGLAVERDARSPLIAAIATGSVLMAHDWRDRSFWFERGHGTQP